MKDLPKGREGLQKQRPSKEENIEVIIYSSTML